MAGRRFLASTLVLLPDMHLILIIMDPIRDLLWNADDEGETHQPMRFVAPVTLNWAARSPPWKKAP